jgi:hypothetical protein
MDLDWAQSPAQSGHVMAATSEPQTILRHFPSTPIKSSLGVNAGDAFLQPGLGGIQDV